MSFGLKKTEANYQGLMDVVFSKHIGRNIKVYIDVTMVNTPDSGKHFDDLRKTLKSIKIYNMYLNPNKWCFGVHAKKFLGFVLTSIWIEENPEKCLCDKYIFVTWSR